MRVSLRQALAAVELTVSKKADGSLDASDVLAFMKGAPVVPVKDLCPLMNVCRDLVER